MLPSVARSLKKNTASQGSIRRTQMRVRLSGSVSVGLDPYPLVWIRGSLVWIRGSSPLLAPPTGELMVMAQHKTRPASDVFCMSFVVPLSGGACDVCWSWSSLF